MTQKLLTSFTILLVNALFIYSHVSAGDSLSKSISVESVLQKVKEKQELILIDVRNSKEFGKFRIPGSVNIPLFAIKTKTFLKPKPLVLINEGNTYKQLIHECTILSESGFTVSILNGGLNQWRQKDGLLEGDVFAQRELNQVALQAFFAAQSSENWIVINASGKSETQNFQSTHIPYSNNPEQFISKLKSAIGNHKEKDFLSILIYDENGKNYEEIERHIHYAGIHNVLYLKGGLEGYKTFEQQQISIREGKKHAEARKTVKTYRNCTTCP
jgi:rhodanese-related sulfurtransferase